VINYRPILIEEVLEASYPSSHTMLALCILTTAIVQFRMRIRQKTVRRCVLITTSVLALAIVIGRTLCGVHWLSDIIGGCLLSTCLIEAYLFCISMNIKQKHL
jgi:undecaprenyl-diphosphatase